MEVTTKFDAIHKESSNNRQRLSNGETACCFYCLERFDSSLIVEWVDEGKTAVCPYCGIDSVLSETSCLSHGFDIFDPTWLMDMSEEMFSFTSW